MLYHQTNELTWLARIWRNKQFDNLVEILAITQEVAQSSAQVIGDFGNHPGLEQHFVDDRAAL